jgi:Fe-S-cluster containining protein
MVLSFNNDQDWPAEKEWLMAHFGVSVESETDGEVLVRFDLACRHLTPASNGRLAACRLEGNKPAICREYPDAQTVDYLREHPELTPGCGYRGLTLFDGQPETDQA